MRLAYTETHTADNGITRHRYERCKEESISLSGRLGMYIIDADF